MSEFEEVSDEELEQLSKGPRHSGDYFDWDVALSLIREVQRWRKLDAERDPSPEDK